MSDPRLADLAAELPQQPPMRLVERVTEIEPGRRARTERRVRPDDWFFDGHFPSRPIVPAIALVELLAQTGGLAAAGGAGRPVEMRLAALNDLKFPASAGPGVLLEATAEVVGRMGSLIKISGTVTADGRVVATGSLTLAETRPDAGRSAS